MSWPRFLWSMTGRSGWARKTSQSCAWDTVDLATGIFVVTLEAPLNRQF